MLLILNTLLLFIPGKKFYLNKHFHPEPAEKQKFTRTNLIKLSKISQRKFN